MSQENIQEKYPNTDCIRLQYNQILQDGSEQTTHRTNLQDTQTPYQQKLINLGSEQNLTIKPDKQQKQFKFTDLIKKIKMKSLIKKALKRLPSRMFKNLNIQQYELIDDASANFTKGPRQQKSASIKVYPQQKSIWDDNNNDQKIQSYIKNQEHSFHQNYFQNFFQFIILQIKKIPVFNPSSTYKLIWDLVQFIIIISFLFFIPLHIIFQVNLDQMMPQGYLLVSLALLILDNLIYFNMGIYNKGKLISDRKIIFNYWMKRMLFQDLLSIIPLFLHIMIDSNQQININQNYDVEKFIKSNEMDYIQLLFFVKIGRVKRLINKLQDLYIMNLQTNNIVALIKLFFFALVVGHFFSCIFLFVGQLEADKGTTNWLADQNIQSDAWYVKYINAYYFAAVTMMTIGFGDITPVTTAEMLVSILLMFISTGIFGYTLNAINQIFDSMYKTENEVKRKRIIINNYMKKKNITKDLQFQIGEYLDYIWRESTEHAEDEEQIRGQLSEYLHEKLLLQANKLVLADSTVFKNNFSEQILQKTVPLITEVKYSPDEVIFKKDDRDECQIYFIEKGTVELFVDIQQRGKHKKLKQKTLQTLEKGLHFGTQSFFTGEPRYYNVKSTEFTTLLMIKRNDFIQLLKDYEEDYERFIYIKDNITNYEKINHANLFCYSCGESHLLNYCPYIHYVPSKYKLLHQFTAKPQQQERQKEFQRRNFKYECKPNAEAIASKLAEYHEVNEVSLDEYEILYQINNSEDEDSNSSSSSCDEKSIESSQMTDEQITNNSENQVYVNSTSNFLNDVEVKKSAPNINIIKDVEEIKEEEQESNSNSILSLSLLPNIQNNESLEKNQVKKQTNLPLQQAIISNEELAKWDSSTLNNILNFDEPDSNNKQQQQQQIKKTGSNKEREQIIEQYSPVIQKERTPKSMSLLQLQDSNQIHIEQQQQQQHPNHNQLIRKGSKIYSGQLNLIKGKQAKIQRLIKQKTLQIADPESPSKIPSPLIKQGQLKKPMLQRLELTRNQGAYNTSPRNLSPLPAQNRRKKSQIVKLHSLDPWKGKRHKEQINLFDNNQIQQVKMLQIENQLKEYKSNNQDYYSHNQFYVISNFDQMKNFIIYFPYNNIENILKTINQSYDDIQKRKYLQRQQANRKKTQTKFTYFGSNQKIQRKIKEILPGIYKVNSASKSNQNTDLEDQKTNITSAKFFQSHSLNKTQKADNQDAIQEEDQQ